MADGSGAQTMRSRMSGRGAASPGFALGAYRALTAAGAGAAPLLLNLRERRGKELRARLAERMGRASIARPDGALVWVHAASVGETNAVLPLLQSLAQRRPDLNLLLTTGTVTSARFVEMRLNGCSLHQFMPLDVPSFARRFLDHWRPDLAIFAESEIWPSFVLELAGRAVPLVLVNGRLSARSARRWSRWPSVSRPLFSAFRLAMAQNERTARQFAALGAHEAIAVGNLKFDAPAPPVDAGERARLHDVIGGRPVFLAASTHPGEDATVVAVHRILKQRHGDLLTVIVPRHPGRGDALADMLRKAELTVAQRSRGEMPDRRCDIYLGDTIGELGLFYSLAPVAFVGGSLADRGGQNPVEAIKLGSAVLTGPCFANFADAYAALLAAEACVKVEDARTLADAASRLIADEPARRRMHERASEVVEALSGALERTLRALDPLLPPPPEAPTRAARGT